MSKSQTRTKGRKHLDALTTSLHRLCSKLSRSLSPLSSQWSEQQSEQQSDQRSNLQGALDGYESHSGAAKAERVLPLGERNLVRSLVQSPVQSLARSPIRSPIRSLALKLALPLLLSLGLSSCGSEREYIDYPIEAQGHFETFENERGWTVELELAQARLGPVRFYEGHPFFSRSMWRLPQLIKSAHAHPGHYDPTEALGELLDVSVVDLLASSPTLLGRARGLSGSYGSAEVVVSDKPSGDDDTLGPVSLRLKGKATGCVEQAEDDSEGGSNGEPNDDQNGDPNGDSKGDSNGSCEPGFEQVTLPFEAALSLPNTVSGISFEHELTAGGKVLLDIDVKHWLARVNFATLSLDKDQALGAVEKGSQAYNALVRGASEGAAYKLSWVAGE